MSTNAFLRPGDVVHWKDMSGIVTNVNHTGSTAVGFTSTADVLLLDGSIRAFVRATASSVYHLRESKDVTDVLLTGAA
jgi:hypothetical protein